MKVLLFTHIVDIDGMGSAILAKLAFSSVNIIYCDTFEITEKLSQTIEDGSIFDYDKIFITDICPSENLIEQIESNPNLSNKVQILDHHISILENLKTKHKIAKIEIENNSGKCSGTSLFYEYLLSNKLLNATKFIDEFVELTREYDTWEWKTKFDNENANDLNIMFSILKKDKYVEYFYNKLRNNFELFDELDLQKINAFKQNQKLICEEYIKTIHVQKIENYSVAVINSMKDEFKNDVAELLKTDNRFNIDLVAMVITARNTLSFRSTKPDVNVGKFAEIFGGKGHKASGSCIITNYVKSIFKIN